MSWRERRELEHQLSQTDDARLYRRLLALLEMDSGVPPTEIARRLRVGRRSIYRWKTRFTAHPKVASLARQPGQGRPAQWSETLAQVVESALAEPPFRFGYCANTWTIPLLQSFLAQRLPGTVISESTLRRGLKARDWTWKRYRYVLAPDPEAEKKTQAPAPNPGFARVHRAVGAR